MALHQDYQEGDFTIGPERKLETWCVAEANRNDCLLFKWEGHKGVPDRILIMPRGRIVLIEFKAPGGATTKIQDAMHKRLRDRGCDVRVIDNKDDFKQLLQEK